MKVVGIADNRKIELTEILRGLVAKVDRDGAFDIALHMTDSRGRESMIFTGRYERDAGFLSRAGFQLQYEAMLAANEPRM